MRVRSVIHSQDLNTAENIFIACVSFEDRCWHGASLLSRSYGCRSALLVRFFAEDREKRRVKNASLLRQYLQSHVVDDVAIDEVWCHKYDPVDGRLRLLNYFQDLHDVRLVTVDISTFTKMYLLMLLREIREVFPSASVRLVYTPAKHRPTVDPPLTRDAKVVLPIPYFGGVTVPEYPRLLILFLGYEGERAYRVWRSLEPDRTVLVFTDPPLYHGAEVPAWRNNERLLKLPNTTIETVNAAEPQDTTRLVSRLVSQYAGFNVSVSVLGPKIEVVGLYCYYLLTRDETLQTLYAAPGAYDERSFTLGHLPFVLEYDLPRARYLAESVSTEHKT
jgi:hypothetical protein